jgi:hypothetical protein
MADLDGFDAMLAQLQGIAARVVATTPNALGKAAHYLEGQIKTELSRTSHPPGTPTPSPPGSPPSLVTGNLRRSAQVEGPTQTGPASWSASVGMESVYARVQELGGGPSNLPARPYVAPTFAASLPAMGALIESAWADALDT